MARSVVAALRRAEQVLTSGCSRYTSYETSARLLKGLRLRSRQRSLLRPGCLVHTRASRQLGTSGHSRRSRM